MNQRLILAPLLSGLALSAAASPAPIFLVVCAPGFPGTTDEAQSFMDDFAAAAAASAGWNEDLLKASYFETEAAGLERLSGEEAGLTLVPLPFLLEHGPGFDLLPLLHAVQDHGKDQQWALVARKGAVSSAATLSGWEITGRPGYSPGFVRGPVLGAWGKIPDDALITFTDRPLSALRRAAAGEEVAVVLDREQTGTLSSLPFGQDLEILTRSGSMPGMLLCAVGDRVDASRRDSLVEGLLRLHKSKEGKEILRSIWMSHFETIDGKSLETIRTAYVAP